MIFDFDKELSDIIKRNELSISGDDYNTIRDIFDATLKEQSKQYYNYASRAALLEGITQQTSQGASPEDIFQTYSDVRHYELYENFMGTSERRRMVNTLKNKGIPLDILKGVKIDEKGDTLTPRPNIKVKYKFTSNERGSLVLEYFYIYENEEIIFDFKNSDFDFDEEIENIPEYINISGRKSLYSGRITNTDIGDVKMWVDKNGRTFYTDSKGHRVKVRNGQVQERIVWEEE